jgi:hypothetical protein
MTEKVTSDTVYNTIIEKDLTEISNDPLKQKEFLDKINEFLKVYNKRKLPDEDPNTPWIELSLKEIIVKTIQTAINIINDISDAISNRELISSSEFRRTIFMAFTQSERRIYVGIWLILFSFILYFIDSAS